MLGPLSDYLDGRAAATEAEVEAHLATCDDCCRPSRRTRRPGRGCAGYLPLVPLGGVLSRFRGKLHGTRSPRAPAAASPATTPRARCSPRIGNALGRRATARSA